MRDYPVCYTGGQEMDLKAMFSEISVQTKDPLSLFAKQKVFQKKLKELLGDSLIFLGKKIQIIKKLVEIMLAFFLKLMKTIKS